MKKQEFRCYWAGQLLEEFTISECDQVHVIESLQRRLDSGQIKHDALGMTFVPTELCVDVYEGGEMVALYNFKKGELFSFSNLKRRLS